MDFLRRHVEKLVLGLALVALLASIAVLLHSLSKTRTTVTGMVDEARSAASGGADITLDDTPPLDVYKELADPKVKFDTLPSEGTPPLRGSLYEPADYILCYNEACSKLIPIGQDKCPFCGTEQPPARGGDDRDKDRDNDGIPNHVEQKYKFLNPDNPLDALMDQDQDGFLNVEEFKANTDMQDATKLPPLGALLRVDRLVEKPLPIMLRRISRNNSDDPAVWQVTVQTFDAAKKAWRNRLSGVGKTIDGFTIRSAAFEADPDHEGKQIATIVVAAEAGGEPYTLREGVQANESDKFVRLLYLASRDAQYARRGGVRVLVHKVGDTFTLTRGREPNLVSETYRVESIAEGKVEVTRTEPAPAQGEDPVRITVPQFNARTDFMPQGGGAVPGAGGPEGMMMMPGMEGAPGAMMPGMPGAGR